MHPRPGHPTQQKGGARCEDYCRYGSAPIGPPSLLAIDVQADLLLPIRNRDIALGRGNDDGLARRGRTELLRQVYRDGQNVARHRHLNILHLLISSGESPLASRLCRNVVTSAWGQRADTSPWD